MRPWLWTCGPGKASAFNSADHIAVLDAALAQLPAHERGQVLVRADTGGASKAFLRHITDLGLEYSVGFTANDTVKHAIEAIPGRPGGPPSTPTASPATGAQVAELTAWLPDRSVATAHGTLADRDADHRPPRTPPPRRAAAVDRPRRLADHLLRHQHQGRAGGWPTWRSGTGNAPAPRTASAA